MLNKLYIMHLLHTTSHALYSSYTNTGSCTISLLILNRFDSYCNSVLFNISETNTKAPLQLCSRLLTVSRVYPTVEVFVQLLHQDRFLSGHWSDASERLRNKCEMAQ